MKFSYMRRVDFYAGFFLCGSLALLRKLRGKNRKAPSLPRSLDGKKVLLVKFLGFGSIILTTPLIRDLKKNYPKSEVHFLTFSNNVQVCVSIPLIDRIHSLEKKSLGKFVVSLAKLLSSLRRERYDVVFNLEFFSNFALLLSSLVGAKHVICFGGRHEYRKTLCQQIVSYENEEHVIDKFSNFLKLFVPESSVESEPLLELAEDPEARRRVLDLLRENNVRVGEDFLVVVNINASEMSHIRKWPIEYFREILAFLLQKKNLKVILIGGGEDIPYVERLEDALSAEPNKIINLTGGIDLKELISLMNVSRLYLGNDSGPLHVAEACRIPSVSFFGPESPKVYGHPGEQNYTFYINLPCSPCLNVYTNKDTSCRENICLTKIKPEEVIGVLQERYLQGVG